jgi:hypothetical protein
MGLGGNQGEAFVAGNLMEGEKAVAEGVIGRDVGDGKVFDLRRVEVHGCHGRMRHPSGAHVCGEWWHQDVGS